MEGSGRLPGIMLISLCAQNCRRLEGPSFFAHGQLISAFALPLPTRSSLNVQVQFALWSFSFVAKYGLLAQTGIQFRQGVA
jgi:hypothetical protein